VNILNCNFIIIIFCEGEKLDVTLREEQGLKVMANRVLLMRMFEYLELRGGGGGEGSGGGRRRMGGFKSFPRPPWCY